MALSTHQGRDDSPLKPPLQESVEGRDLCRQPSECLPLLWLG